MISTHKILLTSLVAFGVVIGMLWWGLYYVFSTSDTLDTQLQNVARADAQANELRKLERQLAQSTSEREALAAYFLAGEADSIVFLNDVERLADALNIMLITLSAADDEQSGALRVRYSLEGARADIERFVTALEVGPKLLRVERFVMSEVEVDGMSLMRSELTVSVPKL